MAGGFLSQDDEFPETADINVTPFIDIMLVLLIIFMVAAPLATVDVPLDLPVSSAKPSTPTSDPIVLSIQDDRHWSVGNEAMDKAVAGAAIERLAKGDHAARIFVRADKGVSYGMLMEAMDVLRAHGFLKISLVGLDRGAAQ